MAESHREEIAKLEALYAANPEGRVFVHLAEALRKAGEHERARIILEEGLGRHPGSASGHVVHGRVLKDLGEAGDAVAAFRRVLDLDSGNLVALRGLGDLALTEGRSADAAELYREVLSRNPTNEEVRGLVLGIEREAETLSLPVEAVAAPSAAPGDTGAATDAEAEYGIVEIDAAGEPAAAGGGLAEEQSAEFPDSTEGIPAVAPDLGAEPHDAEEWREAVVAPDMAPAPDTGAEAGRASDAMPDTLEPPIDIARLTEGAVGEPGVPRGGGEDADDAMQEGEWPDDEPELDIAALLAAAAGGPFDFGDDGAGDADEPFDRDLFVPPAAGYDRPGSDVPDFPDLALDTPGGQPGGPADVSEPSAWEQADDLEDEVAAWALDLDVDADVARWVEETGAGTGEDTDSEAEIWTLETRADVDVSGVEDGIPTAGVKDEGGAEDAATGGVDDSGDAVPEDADEYTVHGAEWTNTESPDVTLAPGAADPQAADEAAEWWRQGVPAADNEPAPPLESDTEPDPAVFAAAAMDFEPDAASSDVEEPAAGIDEVELGAEYTAAAADADEEPAVKSEGAEEPAVVSEEAEEPAVAFEERAFAADGFDDSEAPLDVEPLPATEGAPPSGRGAYEDGEYAFEPLDAGVETETMADLYRSQGFTSRAADVYRALLRRRPDDERLAAKLAELEEQGRRPLLERPPEDRPTEADSAPSSGEAGGAAVVERGDAAGVTEDVSDEVWLRQAGSAWSAEATAAAPDAASFAWAGEPAEGGEPADVSAAIGDFLQELIAWRRPAAPVPAPPPAPEPPAAAPEPPADDGGGRVTSDTWPGGAPDPVIGEQHTHSVEASVSSSEPWSAGVAERAQAAGEAPWASAEGSALDPVQAAFEEWYGAAEPAASADEPERAPSTADDTDQDDEDLAMFRSWLQSLRK
jgi:hypothetical protein